MSDFISVNGINDNSRTDLVVNIRELEEKLILKEEQLIVISKLSDKVTKEVDVLKRNEMELNVELVSLKDERNVLSEEIKLLKEIKRRKDNNINV